MFTFCLSFFYICQAQMWSILCTVMNNNLITFLNPLIAIDKKHDSPTILSIAITKQIKDESHRCLLYNNHTDEQYRKTVRNWGKASLSSGFMSFQLALTMWECILYEPRALSWFCSRQNSVLGVVMRGNAFGLHALWNSLPTAPAMKLFSPNSLMRLSWESISCEG